MNHRTRIRKWLGSAILGLFIFQSTAQAALMPMDDLHFPKARPRKHKVAIPLENNSKIRTWIHFFSGKNRDRFAIASAASCTAANL
jgi:hypothetical protein